jgi:amphi-Trp domain-containing protein
VRNDLEGRAARPDRTRDTGPRTLDGDDRPARAKEATMDILKAETKETLSREEAARRLAQIAQALSSNNEVELEKNGKLVRVRVADQVTLEIDVEVGESEAELEVELTWGR